ILHFSDFHLNNGKLAEAQHIIKYMQKCLEDICKSKKIDLILFSGDILDKGGASFESITNGLSTFVDVVIKPITETIGIPMHCFIFSPGNHDIDRKADNPRMEMNLESGIETWEDIITKLSKADDLSDFTNRITQYKEFEKKHYSAFPEIEYKSYPLLSTYKLQANGLTVGISSLNSVWRCGFDDVNKVVIGLNQISEHTDHLKGCNLKIALTHYPIDMLKVCERDQATILIAKEFDLLCTGHAHSELIKYEGLEKDASFLNVKSAGTLSDNIYEKNSRYKNAFQIIDFNSESGFCVSKYHQPNGQEFLLDNNFGRKKFDFPSHQERAQYIRIQQEEREQQAKMYLKEQVYPFVPIDDYINMSEGLMSSQFISCPAIDRIMAQLVDPSQNRVRFMALSGMGKTRIIAETFLGKENIFYSRAYDCIKAIPSFIRLNKSITLIIDDCDKGTAIRIQKLIDESGKNIRLITVYNVLTPEEKSVSAPILELKYEDTEYVVETMLDKEDSLKDRPEIKEAIKERSGGIPYMALLMIEGYKKNQNIKIEKIDDILSALLEGGKSIEKFASKSMEAISLFEPLGYKDNYSDEYEWICNTPVINHLSLDKETSKCTLDDTVREFLSRQLIEEDGPCIRIRPRPLAEWLTEKWLEKNGETMAEVFNALNSAEESLKHRLTSAVSRRFQEMTDSVFA
ncbi:MAG: metallophosphoesterase, partial [Muribaculaceae bacterium]|nr:metallophosphoesterase [Muribaculaceae bacterium]